MATLQEVLDLASSRSVRRVDLKVADLLGRWQHFTLPAHRLNADLIADGQGFDGSSFRGFQQIHESDMLLMPDLDTAVIDPAYDTPTLSLICDVADPLTRQHYSRDPRAIAKKAEEYLKTTGIADTAYFGPELEFFLFDDVRFQQGQNSAFYFVDSNEGSWNSGREEGGNLSFKIAGKEGYSPAPPFDTQTEIRNEFVEALEGIGIPMELHHHEVATAGQGELAMRFGTLTTQADRSQWYKYVVRNVSRKHGKVATFMAKPIYGDNGTGMHTHQSLWKNGAPAFYDSNGYAGLSQVARWYIGGLLKHAHAVLAFAAPTTNSYKRLVPHYEAPVNLAYSMRNRSASIRIPTYSMSANAKRIEFRPADATCNPYLAFAAMLMAGLDGIQKQTDPGDPLDRNIYELPPDEAAKVPTVPGSLEQALDALEADHDFLLQGGVFTQDVIDTWLEYKRAEAQEVRLRPTPYEYELYFAG
ncbi:MAG: type I glutamate--ammonia ligase [Dehalococcoidia bacterium]|nr:type I glutamate--ammonia ligase [Dehalococcoidia bacterium]HRC62464.1 type I glutamate--ammonia ligase [Dehalococcoidia bacterium]